MQWSVFIIEAKEDKVSNPEYPEGTFINKRIDEEEFMTAGKKLNKKKIRKNRKGGNAKVS